MGKNFCLNSPQRNSPNIFVPIIKNCSSTSNNILDFSCPAHFFLGEKKKKACVRERDREISHFNNLILGKTDPPEEIISSQACNSR